VDRSSSGGQEATLVPTHTASVGQNKSFTNNAFDQVLYTQLFRNEYPGLRIDQALNTSYRSGDIGVLLVLQMSNISDINPCATILVISSITHCVIMG
jgi:hypothetical protein